MSNCGLICILFIWIGFLWPILVSSFYLIINKQKIRAKAKYFLSSTLGGYILLISLNWLIGFLARNFLEINSHEGMNILALSTTMILFIPPVIFSHILFKRTANTILERSSLP